jgi:hypothetical protein
MTLTLGLQPRQGHGKVWVESARECEGMNPHTPKWIPIWELEFQWTPKFSKNILRGQNLLN